MSQLAERKCIPCTGGVPKLDADGIAKFAPEVPEWDVVDRKKLRRTFDFDDFAQALEFVNAVGEIAEEEGHHPNIAFTYGEATIEIWTHKVDGLTESDFILAAKIDGIERPS